MKAILANNPGAVGFTASELRGMQVGNPFSIYTFDEDLELIPNDVIVFPLLYQDNIVGVMEVTYDTVSDNYCFTLGQAYSKELNALRNQKVYDDDSCLVIGNLGDKLFATDGKQTTIFIDRKLEGSTSVTVEDINDATSIIMEAVSSNYAEITTSVDDALLDAVSIGQPTLIQAAAASPNPLPVPHVNQTGNCGCAAWAAVLNYRFSQSYTNALLEQIMKNGGYFNGVTSTGEPAPTLNDHKNYANAIHKAGAAYTTYPMSINSAKSAIDSGKPIMGHWFAGSGSNTTYHAIIITGYQQTTSTLIYYLQNPWYTSHEIITVTGPNLVYSTQGKTWNLFESVH